LKTEWLDEPGRQAAPAATAALQYAKPAAAAHPTSPAAMPSPLTPVDGASFYPTASDVDAAAAAAGSSAAMLLSPTGYDAKPLVLAAVTSRPEPPPPPIVSVPPYSRQFQLAPQRAAAALAPPPPTSTGAGGGGGGSLLADLDDIDALQCHWDMKHFEPGKLTESDLTCLDTAALVTAPSSAIFPPACTAPLVAPSADPAPTFAPIFSSPAYHPYYQQQQQPVIFSSEFSLDYSTPEVKEMLCTGWLESDILNVN